MTAHIDLQVLGLAVIQDPTAQDQNFRVSTVDPPEEANPMIPSHSTYLGVIPSAIAQSSRTTPTFDKRLRYSRRFPTGMRFAKIDPGTTVTFSQPAGKWHGGPAPLKRASVQDLGLTRLKQEVGRGAWQAGEDVRFVLPSKHANATWGDELGKFKLCDEEDPREVADLFSWKARFDTFCAMSIDDNNGKTGIVRLGGSSQIRIICFHFKEFLTKENARRYDSFDHSHAFERLCQAGTWCKPESVRDEEASSKGRDPIDLRHPGSGSCPPVGWP